MPLQAHDVAVTATFACSTGQTGRSGRACAYDDATNWAGLLAQRRLVACTPVLPQPFWAHAYVQVHLYEQSPNQQACNTAQQPKPGAAKVTICRRDEQAGSWLEQVLDHNKCTFQTRSYHVRYCQVVGLLCARSPSRGQKQRASRCR